MKHKSITLIILMLTFLSIFSVNVHLLSNVDNKLDQVNFFKAQFDQNITPGDKEDSTCDQQSADSLSYRLSESFSWFSRDFVFVIIQPFK